MWKERKEGGGILAQTAPCSLLPDYQGVVITLLQYAPITLLSMLLGLSSA